MAIKFRSSVVANTTFGRLKSINRLRAPAGDGTHMRRKEAGMKQGQAATDESGDKDDDDGRDTDTRDEEDMDTPIRSDMGRWRWGGPISKHGGPNSDQRMKRYD